MLMSLKCFFTGKSREFYELKHFIKNSAQIVVYEHVEKKNNVFVRNENTYAFVTKFSGSSYGRYDIDLIDGKLIGKNLYGRTLVTVSNPNEVEELKAIASTLHFICKERQRREDLGL